MWAQILISVLAITAIVVIGFFVILSARKGNGGRSFAVLNFLIAAWLLFQLLAQFGPSGLSLTFAQSANLMANFVAYTFFIFITEFIYGSAASGARKRMYLWLLLPVVVFSALSYTGLLIEQVTVTDDGIAIAAQGVLYTVNIIIIGLYMLAGFVELIGYAIRSQAEKRKQALLLIGFLFFAAFVSIIVNTVFATIPASQILIPFSLLIMSVGILYGIIWNKLFDLRLIAAKLIAYTASLSFIVLLLSVISFVIVNNILDTDIPKIDIILLSIFSAVIAVAFQPLKKFFDKLTNRIFYRDAYNGQEVINKVNSTIVNTIELEKILQDTADTVESMMRLSFADFYLDSKATIEFHLAGTNTRLFANQHWPNFADEFAKTASKSVMVLDDDTPSDLKELMQELTIEAAFKMSTTTDNVGYFVVGQRKSGNSLSSQDIQLLEIIADEVAIAVQNTLRFEEISQFNITLQKKIDDATRELQKSNEKLQKLDEAKDEFISMASHQLRTPLTSVKGYISMMLEGDAGDINDQQKNFLDQAYLSSQRMVYLIADLLNVSRLKTGKFIIEPKPTYLPDVVESEIAQLHETAKARDLKLIFDKPESFPTLNLDETKIRQVIMNFADNAIYYTPKGGKITIGLKATDDSVEYTVRDTGIGVPKSEQHHLFTKFYRAGNAKKARPDGTGLGLFMAKKVVVAQGGAIIFKTEEGKGSTFGFSFPRNKLEVEQ